MARICARPNCNNELNERFNALGEVTLYLESSPDVKVKPLIVPGLTVCGNCSVDLIEWWNRGKK